MAPHSSSQSSKVVFVQLHFVVFLISTVQADPNPDRYPALYRCTAALPCTCAQVSRPVYMYRNLPLSMCTGTPPYTGVQIYTLPCTGIQVPRPVQVYRYRPVMLLHYIQLHSTHCKTQNTVPYTALQCVHCTVV